MAGSVWEVELSCGSTVSIPEGDPVPWPGDTYVCDDHGEVEVIGTHGRRTE